MWETYSAFANTYGGVILLGVKEREDGTFETVGLTPVEAEHLRQDFWNTVSNRSKVSAVLPIESEVEVLEADGGMVVAIHVPRAPREERPVYINGDLFAGTYRRRGEGDYRCTRQEISAMLRDQGFDVFCQIFVGRFGVSFSPFERLFLGRFGFGQSCGLSVIA